VRIRVPRFMDIVEDLELDNDDDDAEYDDEDDDGDVIDVIDSIANDG